MRRRGSPSRKRARRSRRCSSKIATTCAPCAAVFSNCTRAAAPPSAEHRAALILPEFPPSHRAVPGFLQHLLPHSPREHLLAPLHHEPRSRLPRLWVARTRVAAGAPLSGQAAAAAPLPSSALLPSLSVQRRNATPPPCAERAPRPRPRASLPQGLQADAKALVEFLSPTGELMRHIMLADQESALFSPQMLD